jgi:hypothetical protein
VLVVDGVLFVDELELSLEDDEAGVADGVVVADDDVDDSDFAPTLPSLRLSVR